MKKILFVFVAFVAMTFAACGGQTAPAITEADSAVVDSLDSIVSAADSIVADSVVAE